MSPFAPASGFATAPRNGFHELGLRGEAQDRASAPI
jgi:hypothetical protein